MNVWIVRVIYNRVVDVRVWERVRIVRRSLGYGGWDVIKGCVRFILVGLDGGW